jgi:tetratricopeptide (TPR) repeat protein
MTGYGTWTRAAEVALPAFSKDRWPADGAVRALLEYLDALHRDAGQPSSREIGKAIGLAHSTVAPFFTGTRLIGKGNLELLVQYLGGDPAQAERLRKQAATEWNTHSRRTVIDKQPAEASSSGPYPAVWNVPRRNLMFTGRDGHLSAIRERLTTGGRALVHALSGMGGVGKTQLAIEYAHRHAAAYQLVWWIDAERADLVADQLATLAVKAGWAGEESATVAAVHACMTELRSTTGWLVVFDNVDAVDRLAPLLPPESGHVIITSRGNDFAGLTVPVEVDTLTRAESVALLRQHVPTMADADADRLADALGDLPLALVQAAGMMSQTRMPVAEYLAELAERGTDVLSRCPPFGYPTPLAAAIDMSVSRLADEDSAAATLLHVCAMLAPEPIQLSWFTAAPPGVLDTPLAAVAAHRLAWRDALGRIARYGLAQVTGNTIQLHRLTRMVLRDRRTQPQRTSDLHSAEHLVAAAAPDDGADPACWSTWSTLLPHILTLSPSSTAQPLRATACAALWYLSRRGDDHTAHRLAEDWERRWRAAPGSETEHIWVSSLLGYTKQALGHNDEARRLNEKTLARARETLGEDHAHTLFAANNLAINLHQLGEYEPARALSEDTYLRRRRVLGEDHPNTSRSLCDLAANLHQLGDFERARVLDEENLARSTRVLGADHPVTMTVANNLARDLLRLGRYEQARALDEDTLARRRRVLGDEHPETVRSISNLAYDLLKLGRHEQARALDEDALARRRRILGEYHPDTLRSMSNLAVSLHQLGEYERALALNEVVLARRRVLDEDHPATLFAASNLARDLRKLGDVDRARALDEDTLARRRRVLGDGHPDTLTSVDDLAESLRLLGGHSAAPSPEF